MSRFKLLALDIDGTLVNSRDELTPPTRAAIRRACDAGIRVVLATGRRYSKVLHLVEPLELDVPLVTASGALIKDPIDHRTLFCAEFKAGVLEATLQTVAAAGHDVLLYGDTFADGFDFYCRSFLVENQPQLAEYFQRNRVFGREFPSLPAAPPPGIFAGFAMSTQPAMADLGSRLVREFGDDFTVKIPGEIDVQRAGLARCALAGRAPVAARVAQLRARSAILGSYSTIVWLLGWCSWIRVAE
jgi:hydroxymethylpyrimidine pyrophosphatase-like HAD family hydrolase